MSVRGMTIWRVVLMVSGLAVGLVGAVKLLQSGLDNLVATAISLGVGVVAHDGLIAPATLVLTVVAVRILPERVRAPATLGLIVLGSATLLAIPVLSGEGERPDNPTLLDRNYWAGWGILTSLVVVWVAAMVFARRNGETGDGHGTGASDGGER